VKILHKRDYEAEDGYIAEERVDRWQGKRRIAFTSNGMKDVCAGSGRDKKILGTSNCSISVSAAREEKRRKSEEKERGGR
jgi:hypothetical protein